MPSCANCAATGYLSHRGLQVGGPRTSSTSLRLPGLGARCFEWWLIDAHPAAQHGQLGLSGWCGGSDTAASVEQHHDRLRSGSARCAAMTLILTHQTRWSLTLFWAIKLHTASGSALRRLQLAAEPGAEDPKTTRVGAFGLIATTSCALLHTFVAMRSFP